jgi:hypothetical protein
MGGRAASAKGTVPTAIDGPPLASREIFRVRWTARHLLFKLCMTAMSVRGRVVLLLAAAGWLCVLGHGVRVEAASGAPVWPVTNLHASR